MSCDDLLTFARTEPGDPFPHTIVRFPMRLEVLQPPPMAAVEAEARPAHVPGHLPAFPDIHTCVRWL